MSGAIPIAILAAGRASRFGGGKLDAPCAGKPLGRWIVEAVRDARLPPGFLIVGPRPPAFAQDAMLDGWALLTNPAPEEGIGTSVALAARHAQCLGADALIILLADMPLVDAALLCDLHDHAPMTQPVATRHSGKGRGDRPGVPARFPASMLDDLATLTGDQGAGRLLGGRTDLHLLDRPLPLLTDVDDADSLAMAARLLSDSI